MGGTQLDGVTVDGSISRNACLSDEGGVHGGRGIKRLAELRNLVCIVMETDRELEAWDQLWNGSTASIVGRAKMFLS